MLCIRLWKKFLLFFHSFNVSSSAKNKAKASLVGILLSRPQNFISNIVYEKSIVTTIIIYILYTYVYIISNLLYKRLLNPEFFYKKRTHRSHSDANLPRKNTNIEWIVVSNSFMTNLDRFFSAEELCFSADSESAVTLSYVWGTLIVSHRAREKYINTKKKSTEGR